MLVTDIGDSFGHKHSKDVTNIEILPPTSKNCHQHNDVTNITMSPTSLSPTHENYGQAKNNSGRKMCLDNRTIQHQDLHPKTAVQEELFHTSTSLDWQPMTDHSRGMHSVSEIIIICILKRAI